jgi:hypothetical protein
MNKDNVNINSDFWVGVVEDNSSDPLKIGQCKVRIIGTHSFDATELPVEGLPWAIPTIPLNTSKTVSVPNVADWVFGYFLDGPNKQMPIILGIMPGLINKTTYVKLTGQQQREYLQKLVDEPVPPATMNTNDGVVPGETAPQKGEPTTPKISRGVVANTSIAITNQNLGHTCHLASELKLLMNKAKLETASIMIPIREAIVAQFSTGGALSPALTGIKEFALFIADQLRIINNLLEQIIEPIAKIIAAINEIRAVIEYILSLPERIAAYIQNCLDDLYSALVKGAFSIVSEATNLGTGDITNEDLTLTAQAIGDSITQSQEILKNVATIASSPVAIANALLSPSNLTDDEKKNLTKEIFPNVVNFENNLYRTI